MVKRDVSIIELNREQSLLIACDSLGGIGPKEGDALAVSGELVGRLAVRVALMEVLALRARVVSVVNTLSVEYEPTGKEIIAGIEQEMEILDLDRAQILNGSTEENIATLQTGVGITVIGVAEQDKLKLANSKAGDILVALGLPRVGEEVVSAEEVIANLKDLEFLLSLDYIADILPVGSKGINYEAQLLAKLNNLELELNSKQQLDLEKSAGPATVLLCTLARDRLYDLKKNSSKTISLIGNLKIKD